MRISIPLIFRWISPHSSLSFSFPPPPPICCPLLPPPPPPFLPFYSFLGDFAGKVKELNEYVTSSSSSDGRSRK